MIQELLKIKFQIYKDDPWNIENDLDIIKSNPWIIENGPEIAQDIIYKLGINYELSKMTQELLSF